MHVELLESARGRRLPLQFDVFRCSALGEREFRFSAGGFESRSTTRTILNVKPGGDREARQHERGDCELARRPEVANDDPADVGRPE
jgi:hypothetical protein